MQLLFHIIMTTVILLLKFSGSQATASDSFFNELEEGQSIVGKVGSQLTVRTRMECSTRCIGDCKGYQYTDTLVGNCLLIYTNSTEEEGEILKADTCTKIFEKDYCDPNPCHHGATCLKTGDADRCECQDGYYGNHCEEQDNCFPSNNCSTGATCVDGENSYSCSCPSILTGVFCEVCILHSNTNWNPPHGWTGCSVALYEAFDDAEKYGLKEGAGTVQNDIPLVSGQVNTALALNHTRSQWVDLGVHTDVSLTRPDTCGAAGGAISLWVNVIDNDEEGGIVSCYRVKSGSMIFLSGSNLRFDVYKRYGAFQVSSSRPSGWTHLVLNYIGPDYGKGIRVYYNGELVASDIMQGGGQRGLGDGKIVVGRQLTNSDQRYSSVRIDELLLFNNLLPVENIRLLAGLD